MLNYPLSRHRRVKCDEAKPFCNRCLSGHRVCEGYGIILKPWTAPSSDDIVDQEPRVGVSRLLPKPANTISSLPGLNRAQQRDFAYTRSQVVAVTHGLRSLSFWRNVILPACHQEPSVLHAVLALTHTGHHSTTDARRNINDSRRDHLCMLMEYNSAIQSLTKAQIDQRDDAHSLRVTLIACILFTAIELRTGRITEAIKHLGEGRKLFLSLDTHLDASDHRKNGRPRVLLPSRPQCVDEEILAIFADLDIQATWFGSSRPQWELVPRHSGFEQLTSEDTMSSKWSAEDIELLHEAQQHLTILLNEVVQLTGQRLNAEQHSVINHATGLQRHHLVAGLDQWRICYERRCLTWISGHNTQDPWKTHAALMLIHHAWLTVFLSVSHWEVKETAYDGYARQFRTIVDMAAMVLPENEVQAQPFSLDFGLILPLWSTAMKCRHPRVRREALALLRRAGNEGLWDASLVAFLAEETIKIEEDTDVHEGGNYVVTSLVFSQSVPLDRRISGVEVDREDDSSILVTKFQKRLWAQDGTYAGEEYIVKRLMYPSYSSC